MPSNFALLHIVTEKDLRNNGGQLWLLALACGEAWRSAPCAYSLEEWGEWGRNLLGGETLCPVCSLQVLTDPTSFVDTSVQASTIVNEVLGFTSPELGTKA